MYFRTLIEETTMEKKVINKATSDKISFMTYSTFYAVRDLYEICYENGGLR